MTATTGGRKDALTAIAQRLIRRGALLGLVLLTAACATGPPTDPIPRIETGMHTASIRRIATDRDGRWLVTASHDKTARVWNLSTGALAQVLRPPPRAEIRGSTRGLRPLP